RLERADDSACDLRLVVAETDDDVAAEAKVDLDIAQPSAELRRVRPCAPKLFDGVVVDALETDPAPLLALLSQPAQRLFQHRHSFARRRARRSSTSSASSRFFQKRRYFESHASAS